MQRYLKYSILALFAGATVYFTASVVHAMTAPADAEIDVQLHRVVAPNPNFLITDANAFPPR